MSVDSSVSVVNKLGGWTNLGGGDLRNVQTGLLTHPAA